MKNGLPEAASGLASATFLRQEAKAMGLEIPDARRQLKAQALFVDAFSINRPNAYCKWIALQRLTP